MKYRANTCRPMRNMTENAGLKNAGPYVKGGSWFHRFHRC